MAIMAIISSIIMVITTAATRTTTVITAGTVLLMAMVMARGRPIAGDRLIDLMAAATLDGPTVAGMPAVRMADMVGPPAASLLDPMVVSGAVARLLTVDMPAGFPVAVEVAEALVAATAVVEALAAATAVAGTDKQAARITSQERPSSFCSEGCLNEITCQSSP